MSYPVAGIPLQDLPPAYSDEKGPPPTNTIKGRCVGGVCHVISLMKCLFVT